ncbi:hypothetical protein M0R45_009985 [Rubus argutus]|uniref:Uncharacterized protein n=1 Tax=Rubus argutus TaxID=59490 RepID=A0AAW1Y8L3_RUBAR
MTLLMTTIYLLTRIKSNYMGTEQGQSWIARPVTGQSTLGLVSRHGSMASKSGLVDPLVTLFGSVHEKLPDAGSKGSMLFPHFGSMFSVGGNQPRHEEWDEESLAPREGDDYASDAGAGGDSDDNLHTGSTGIGGGWQLAWKWSEKDGQDGHKEGGFKRIYLHQEGVPGSRRGSIVSIPGGDVPEDSEFIQAAALVSQPALYSRDLIQQHHPIGPAMVHPAAASAKGPTWSDLFEPGVKHALVVGVGIQILQQFSGINGVLYYTPQILEQAGVGVLLSNLGLGSASASLLISGLTTLLMLPSIAVAMRLMDISGRRTLLLTTIPVLIASLVILVVGSLVKLW